MRQFTVFFRVIKSVPNHKTILNFEADIFNFHLNLIRNLFVQQGTDFQLNSVFATEDPH